MTPTNSDNTFSGQINQVSTALQHQKKIYYKIAKSKENAFKIVYDRMFPYHCYNPVLEKYNM
jgi:hypothetical protein